jgi:hypothetical protein
MLPTSIALATLPPLPQKCPSVPAIQAVGVSRVVIQIDNRWFAGRRQQHYDTTEAWSFIVANINATDAKEAYNIAAANLPSLAFRMGPFEASDHWVCLYNTDLNDLPAITVTNPIGLEEAPVYL